MPQLMVHLSPVDFENEADLIAYAKAHPTDWMACYCRADGRNCDNCGGDGVYQAWRHDPDITGYPNERPDGL